MRILGCKFPVQLVVMAFQDWAGAIAVQQHQPFVHPSSMLNVTGASPPSSSSSSAAAATATNPIIGLSSVSVAGTFTSGAAAGTHSTTSSGSGDLANATSLSIGGIVTIERKGLAEARISKYEIEVNGRIVGECKNTEDYTNIQRLKPSCIYQLRVWAISESRGRAPSQPIFVHTLSTHEAQMRASTSQKDASPSNSASNENSSAVDVNSIRLDIDISQRKIKALEENIAQLKAHSEDEKGRLQKEIAELKTKRKEEESAKTVQREKIRELEAEKRRLDREKDRLDKEIADARNRKQRALEWMQEQEKQAETCLRNAKALEDAMERESRDHQQQQAELKNTIHVIKMEVGKVKQRLDGLTSQQIDISEQLKDKRATLAVQEKKNAELERKLKEALQRRQPTKEDRAKVAQYNERIQAEIDLLVPQLNETTCERQRLEMAVGSIKHTADATSPIPIAARHSPVYGIGGVSTANLPGGGVAKSQTFSYPMKSLPARRSQNMRGNSGSASNDGTASHHARSSSFTADAQPGQRAQDSLASIQTSALAPLGYSSQLTGSMDSSPVATRIGFNSAAARRSTDLSDLLSFWDRYNALSVAAPTSPTSASIAQPANAFMRHRGIVPSTAAIDSLSLINASGSSVATIHAFDSDSGVGGIGSVDFEYGRHLSPVGGSRPQFWGSPSSASSLSTTTAEASALSILKDTDLAYPTPERPSQREARKYAELMARRDYSQAQPPPQPLFGNTSSGFKNHHQRALGRMLAGSFESLDQQRGMSAQTSPHFRFNSLDMRAAGAWPDFDYPGQPGALGSVGAGASAGVGAGGAASSDNGGGDGRESGRSSTVNDRLSSPCADGAGDTDPFSLRSITPADQPSMLLSNGDLLGIHRPLASSAALHERPHVEPIGAPVRRRPGPSSPPPGSAAQGKQMAPAPAQRNELCPANGPFKIPIQREISHPSSFGNSLYQKRSLWDIDIPSSEQQHRSAAKK
ncbi:hypothetical protein GGI12_002542 [Dipsacomyces acuminosporus]|nr:hypothetical protein GGI12_002542 [Dipsacomyces acuminosporus]